ncbi:LADA_0H19152g1_1 [Lachancea dasiensis]|uniref:LADA_0H19152g1_1 n=1 Tax=Lachancea dasiensis TaxID=1072105 RepID=A0A1G4K684_9SACH|nr:LADA_0H19152g1_1 [Lachancea dasiensis]
MHQKLYPRSDRTAKSDSSSSQSSTSSSSSSSCSGSGCEKPTDSTETAAVVVAVVVPVFVVAVVLALVLYKVWKRGKKEANFDNDPEFDGDGEYLPSVDHNVELRERSVPGRMFDTNYDHESKDLGYPRNSYHHSVSNSNFPVDPFHLPDSSDADQLRSFARSIQNHDLDGYKLASRSASEVSLPKSSFGLQRPHVASLTHLRDSFGSSNMQSVESVSHWTKMDDDNLAHELATKVSSELNEDVTSEIEDSPIKNARGDVKQGYITSTIGLDPEKSARESTSFNTDDSSSHRSFVDASREISQHNDSALPADDENEQFLTSKEEENIKRMKSIYEVYLDRNGTVKTERTSGNDHPEEMVSVNRGFNTSELLPAEASSQINSAVKAQQSYQQSASISNPHFHEEHSRLPLPVDNGRRPVSSIYSDMPSFPQQSAQPGYSQMHLQQAPQAYYQPQYQQQPYNGSGGPHVYAHQAHALQQYYHPQALENIEELPTPSHLPFSESTSSLTSYKKIGKSTYSNGVSGPVVNPIDHPELFYNQTSAPVATTGTLSNHANQAQSLPHHLRQSVVMTNPADLMFPKVYKPAGSFRNISAANSRNNSLTSQNNVQQFQSQMAHQRVSGILDDDDTMQPPRFGGILPHNGSNEDLRRQLGSSENYTVT